MDHIVVHQVHQVEEHGFALLVRALEQLLA